MFTLGSVFSGIGGLDIGLERAGMTVKWQCEIDPYALKVLEKHWPNVKRYGNVKEIKWEEVENVDCICGGFPCPPVSVAGKRKGISDERWLWREFARCIRILQPRWVVIENVRGLLSANAGGAFAEVLRDLSNIGYDAEWGIVSAEFVGAPHRRERVFIVAHSQRLGRGGGDTGNKAGNGGALQTEGRCSELAHSDRQHGYGRRNAKNAERRLESACVEAGTSGNQGLAHSEGRADHGGRGTWRGGAEPTDGSGILGNPDRTGPQGREQSVGEMPYEIPPWPPGPKERDEWAEILRHRPELAPAIAIESRLRGMAHDGAARNRMDRLRCLGNAVVPQAAEVVGRMILRRV